MYSASEQEKEFYAKNDPINSVKDLSDRELSERQVFYLMNIEKNSKVSRMILQFWFVISILSILIYFLAIRR